MNDLAVGFTVRQSDSCRQEGGKDDDGSESHTRDLRYVIYPARFEYERKRKRQRAACLRKAMSCLTTFLLCKWQCPEILGARNWLKGIFLG